MKGYALTAPCKRTAAIDKQGGRTWVRPLLGELVFSEAELVTCPLNNIYYPSVATAQALLILRSTSAPSARHT